MIFSGFFLYFWVISKSFADDVKLGGLFGGNEDQEKAFRYAIDRINKNSEGNAINPLVDNNKYDEINGAYLSMMSTCNFFNEGVVGIFGPKIWENVEIVQSLCDEKEIPHLLARFQYSPIRTGTILNFYPHPPILSKAYTDILLSLEWKTFTILYENDEGFMGLVQVMKNVEEKGVVVNAKKLDQFKSGNYRPVLKEVQKSGQVFFVVDCHIDHLREVLMQMQQVGMMTSDYNYFITNLDAHTEDLAPFQYGETNITGIRIVNPDSEYVQTTSSELYAEDEDVMFTGPIAAWKLKAETAMVIDAVDMFSKALHQISAETWISNNFQCNNTESWAYGYSIINLMKTMSYRGLTGNINFNHEGFRGDFELDIFELREGGVIDIGTWNATNGINITRPGIFRLEEGESLKNKTFIVITALTDPYGMLKETHEVLEGNDRFEGYGIDLFHELSIMEGFNYTFTIRVDKKNGARDPETGEWSGMIGDLIGHRADLAITDLTITSERAEAVDFTTPFMNLGISILFRKPGKAPPSFFSFADPFAIETWAALGFAFFVVSFSLYIMGRLSPDEWTNPYPCIEEPEYLVNQWSLQNSFWFSIGSLMQQGSEIAPIGVSTRMTAGVWWFFVLIMASSYTANLAAFLATENPIELFTDVSSLVENAEKFKIRYGAKQGGATETFFRESKNPLYLKIAEHMKNHKEDMPTENKDGVILAEKETYAFFMESTSIQYETQRHCDLQMYGNLLDDKGYGIAMRKNSPYRQQLTTAILKLQAAGTLENLKRKWWEERRGGGQCLSEGESADATPLNLPNVEGVFYVTIYGVICAAILVITEHLTYVYSVKRRAKITYVKAFKLELQSYLNFDSNVKPVITEEQEEESKENEEEGKDKSEHSNKDDKEKEEESPVNDKTSIVEPYGFKIPSKNGDSPKSNSASTAGLIKSKQGSSLSKHSDV